MNEKNLSMLDVLVETHINLERQGPGSNDMTVKALSFIDSLDETAKIADLGCGTGGQTMILAENIKGNITGVDVFPDFVGVFNDKAQKLGLGERVKCVVGSMDKLSFNKEELDLIWSEGAIDNIGFENGLKYWHGFLKTGGFVAVTNPSWFNNEHPSEVEKFWKDAGSELAGVEENIAIMQSCGYDFTAAFALPENCWTDNYFSPRKKAEDILLRKYAGNEIVEHAAENNRREIELYAKYKQHYGYAFYIGRKQ